MSACKLETGLVGYSIWGRRPERIEPVIDGVAAVYRAVCGFARRAYRWKTARRGRRELPYLNDRILMDLGMTRADIVMIETGLASPSRLSHRTANDNHPAQKTG